MSSTKKHLRKMSNETETKRALWVMPEWMEPFRKSFNNTGGNTVEDLMNNNTPGWANEVLATLSICAETQVVLLTRLHKQGLLINPITKKPTNS